MLCHRKSREEVVGRRGEVAARPRGRQQRLVWGDEEKREKS
jgi:hypothetical protein